MRIITVLTIAFTGWFAVLAAPAAAFVTTGTPVPAPKPDFTCTGNVHAAAIALWKNPVRAYVAKQIALGLNKEGDVYVLYNVQEYLQSFVEMTRRCKDTEQINELAETLNAAFLSLRPLPSDPASRGWVCTGGHTCTRANRLLGHEVQLCSAQFLGLLGAVATDIVENVPVGKRTPAEQSFLENASSAMAVQVNHWLAPAYFKWVAERMAMTPASVKNGSSKSFFEDRDLWFMTTLSDLSELHEANVTMNSAGAAALHQLQSKRQKIAGMFNLFLKRTTLVHTPDGTRAELDRGYWRDYADNRYALYSGGTSPVMCHKDSRGKVVKTIQVPAKASYIDPDMGWDISHARRLVPALATFARNKGNLGKVFGYVNSHFDPSALQRAFANQIVDLIWNQNQQYPLFSNFWDGSNGWYRVGYNNGTGHCVQGYPPYGLTSSIPTGGYLQWGEFNSTLRSLGQRLHVLPGAEDVTSKAFISKYYGRLQVSSKANVTHDIRRLMFVSSLVGS